MGIYVIGEGEDVFSIAIDMLNCDLYFYSVLFTLEEDGFGIKHFLISIQMLNKFY